MRIDVQAIDRVQQTQILEGMDSLCKRLHLNKDEVIADAMANHGVHGSVFLSGLATGIDLGIDLARSLQYPDPETDHGSHDEFLATLPEAQQGYVEGT